MKLIDTDSAQLNEQAAYVGKPTVNANLVLEGGAMRCMFTAGVLDYFMDNDLWCETVIGVSAGALSGYNYVAGEVGRTCYLNMKYCNDPQYLSMRNFALTGNAIREDYMFDEIPNHLDPLNYSHFDESPMKLITVASNIELGEADYHVMENGRDTRYLLASASIPLVSQIIELDGKKLLDGGSCDSVPVTYSRLLGNTDKHIVVLTHHADFVKRPNRVMPLANRVYSDYPLFVERLEYRHYEYNRLYRMIRRLHDEGVIFAVFPPEPVEVANMEKDPAKLFALYEQGYAHAAEQWDALSAYLAR
ncbi:patatin-like phospholipase family protein [Slackia heliotrinireducens]|uniref:patatin-like phospholipase family protein n=1 Tax=Slackia heliotrinireducens TaxID=84110 RepID=UPI0033154836